MRKKVLTSMKSPAQQYLALIRKSIAGIRRDLGDLAELGERMAGPLLRGGSLFAPPVAGWWPSEFGGRAGGFMGLRYPHYAALSGKDVALLALPDPRRWNPREDKTLNALVKSKARLFVIGRREEIDLRGSIRARGRKRRGDGTRFAGFTGGAAADEGLYGTQHVRPLATVRQFEQLMRGWIAAGELIAACTRGGKMPTIWMSVWLEGSLARNASMTRHDNLREPWGAPFLHDNHYVPPLPPGCVGAEFLAFVERILGVIESQGPALAEAGKWMAQAKQAGRRVFAVITGHSYPAILDRPSEKDYPLEWGRSISDLSRAFPADLGRGDVALHLGYGPVDAKDVQNVLKRGLRLIHTSPYGRRAGMKDYRNFLWLDLPWRPGDACVDVPGYSVRILPSSSSAQTIAYNAILCEMAERMGWK